MTTRDAIAAGKQAAVESALASVFGEAPVALAPISGGASGARIFRADGGGRRAVLRVEGVPSPLRFPGQYRSWQAASDGGIAPPLLYCDAEGGVTVSAFVAQVPLRDYPGGSGALAEAVATLLRHVRKTPCFAPFLPYPEIVARLFAHVMRTGVFADGVLASHAAHLARLQAATPWGAQVSAHNDPNPRNLLFDGTRLWLIDWESAYCNDPLVDIAIGLDNFAATATLEERFLRAACDTPPDLARLSNIRALTRLYYAGVFLSTVATMPPAAPETDLSAPSRAEFLAAVAAGRLAYGSRETLLALGKLFLSGFMTGAPVVPLDAI